MEVNAEKVLVEMLKLVVTEVVVGVTSLWNGNYLFLSLLSVAITKYLMLGNI